MLLDAKVFLPVDNGAVVRPSPIGENLGVVHYDDRYLQPGGTIPTILGYKFQRRAKMTGHGWP